MIPMSVRSGRAVGRSRAAAAAVGVLALSLALPAAAQNNDLRSLADQVQRLQRELADLQRTVYSGSAVGGDASNLDASQEIRIQQIESQMSGLTGQIEELDFKVNRLTERIDKLAEAVGTLMHGEQPPAGQPMADATAGAAPASTGAAATSTDTSAPPHTFQAQLEAAEKARESAPTDQPGQTSAPQTAAAPAAAYQLPGNTPDEQYQYAFGLLRQANYAEAEQALRAFIERNPNSPLAGNAQYWLGETYYVRGDYQNAAVAFAEGYQKYPESGKAPDNLLKLGMSLGEIGSKADACTALNELDKQFPGAPGNIKERAARERGRLGC